MPTTGVEPARACAHQHLKLACLPRSTTWAFEGAAARRAPRRASPRRSFAPLAPGSKARAPLPQRSEDVVPRTGVEPARPKALRSERSASAYVPPPRHCSHSCAARGSNPAERACHARGFTSYLAARWTEGCLLRHARPSSGEGPPVGLLGVGPSRQRYQHCSVNRTIQSLFSCLSSAVGESNAASGLIRTRTAPADGRSGTPSRDRTEHVGL